MKNKAFEKLVQKSLTKGKYRHCDPCKRDVFQALVAFKGLAPQYDTFVFDNGDERTLLNVNGTIPIVYKGGAYNIPVCFWLLTDYPLSAPMAFVKPTHDMQIKTSSNVDYTGRIDLPYLSEWRQPESNLMDLVQLCILVFGQSPPVFSRTSSRQQLSQQVSISSLSSSSSSLPVSRQSSVQQQQQQEHHTNGDDLISAEELRMSLISAVEERIRGKLEEEFMKTKAEVQSLHSMNRELLDGQERIEEILTAVGHQTTELDTHSVGLAEKTDELQEVLNKLSEIDIDAIDVDQVVLVPNSLQNQILEAFALDSAIDDAIYSLGRALHRGVIECPTYLKKVRELSRRQFLQRVIVHKCKQRSGMERSWSGCSDAS